MRRRGRAGVAAVLKRKEETAAFREAGRKLEEGSTEHVEGLLRSFKESLRSFAEAHRKDINEDPQFRRYFHVMCSKIGVDPLASQKGFWAEYLGFGDFYYELAVQITEICIATRDTNGGVMSMSELLRRLRIRRQGGSLADAERAAQAGGGGEDAAAAGLAAEVTADDVLTAIGKLRCLGKAFRAQKVGLKQMIFSVPQELSSDELAAMMVAQHASEGEGAAFFTREMLLAQDWAQERVERVVASLLQQEMVWLDASPGQPARYWFVSLWMDGGREDDASDDEG